MKFANPIVLAAVLAAAACATGTPTAGNPYSQDAADRQEVRIEVQNRNFADATVWALVRDGRRQRLGVVTGKSDSVFTIPWSFSEPLRLQFDLVAGPRCTTENLPVDPGDSIELQIANEIHQMTEWCPV